MALRALFANCIICQDKTRMRESATAKCLQLKRRSAVIVLFSVLLMSIIFTYRITLRIMGKHTKCCIKGCSDWESSRHGFPNPAKQPERFKKWILLCGNTDLLNIDPKVVYQNRRVCDLHFRKKDFKSNKFLCRDSIPSLNMPKPLEIPLEVKEEMDTNESTPSDEGTPKADNFFSVVVNRYPKFGTKESLQGQSDVYTMNSSHIAVLTRIPLLLQELTLVLPKIKFKEVTTATDPILKQSEIIISDFDLITLALYDLPNTKWIQGTWAGVDKLVPGVDPQKTIPFIITRFSGKHFGRMMSEYVITQIVNHERSFNQISLNQKECRWSQEGKLSEFRVISDLNIGVMGLGQIGSWVVKVLKMLGASTFGFGRRQNPDEFVKNDLSEYYTKTNLVDFLKRCDYIVNILPNTLETKGLLNGGVLKNCKERNVVFINIGRGSIVSDEDLIEALDKKWISTAILDVFNTEPLPNDSPLWKIPQVKITPHVSAPSRAKDIAEQFKENYHQYKNNGNLSAVFNILDGY